MSDEKQHPPRRSREVRQQKMHNNESYNRDKDPDHWGHRLRRKNSNTTRICLVNINGIGMSKKSKKSEELRQFMEDEAVDAMNIVETNVNWSKVRSMHTLWERTKAWFEHRRIAVSYNMKDGVGTTRRQQGGTATILRNKIAHTRTRLLGLIKRDWDDGHGLQLRESKVVSRV